VCKSKSLILTKENVYYSNKSNSHEEIKKEHNLKDTEFSQLCIAELYPRGKKVLSFDRVDWELYFENQPNWLIEDIERYKDRVYKVLFEDILPRWRKEGIKELFDLSGLGYSSLPSFEGIPNIHTLDCSCNQLTQLTVPEGIHALDCSDNRLTQLTVPEGIHTLNCSCNQLTQLTVPEGIHTLNCSCNQLTQLTVPEGIHTLNCSYNQLTQLTVPEGIHTLYCSCNQLTQLTVPEGIHALYCYNNQLTQLTVPEGIHTLDCSHNAPNFKKIIEKARK